MGAAHSAISVTTTRINPVGLVSVNMAPLCDASHSLFTSDTLYISPPSPRVSSTLNIHTKTHRVTLKSLPVCSVSTLKCSTQFMETRLIILQGGRISEVRGTLSQEENVKCHAHSSLISPNLHATGFYRPVLRGYCPEIT